ncbi:hypothetical protein HYX10_05950 [Candidatus Woesearchaeota archaeon]|nr:hypothetical protein [Candidatus Woesearchaeota archaeon]
MGMIKLGLPIGSLNNRSRVCLHDLLRDAGYTIRGYEPGGEDKKLLRFDNDDGIEPRLVKAKNSPLQLAEEYVDVLFAGRDCMENGTSSGSSFTLIGEFEYGVTRLSLIALNGSGHNNLDDMLMDNKGRALKVFTEYEVPTAKEIRQDDTYRRLYGNRQPVIRMHSVNTGENPAVQVIYSHGGTEHFLDKDKEDVAVVDTVRTGRTIKSLGAHEIHTIMQSHIGLYLNSSCDGWKRKKAEEIFAMVQGADFARNRYLIKFNVRSDYYDGVIKYIGQSHSDGKMQTVSWGEGLNGQRFAAVEAIVPRKRYPELARSLIGLGASDIVQSSPNQVILNNGNGQT